MFYDTLETPSGVVRELFLRSDYSSPEEIRPEIANFEKSTKILKARLIGPENNRWVLEFTDLEREVGTGTGEFEKYYFNVRPIFEGRLWDVSSNVAYQIFQRTINRLVSFSSKLEHAFIPPKFIEQIANDRRLAHQVLAFSAGRDYFAVHVSANPGTQFIGDLADLRLKSTNASYDFEILVKKDRPVGALLLHSMDIELKHEDTECSVRIASDGFICQIGRGDRDLYLNVRDRLIRFFEEQDRWLKFIPQVQIEHIEAKEQGLEFTSKKVSQFGKPFLLTLSFEPDNLQLLKLKGLFTSNFHGSGFIGTVEMEDDMTFTVRTTDLNGGGDLMIEAKLGSKTVSIVPLTTTKIRTLERAYKIILEKFDVDADLLEPKF